MATLATSEHSRKRSLNDTSCSYEPYFLDFENDKIRKNMSDFRLTSVKTIQKYLTSFPLLCVVQRPCLYMHPLEIQPKNVILCLHGNPCKNKSLC